MLKRNYYCLVAGLPDLFFAEGKSGLNSLIFRKELKLQLDKKDFNLIDSLFIPYDNRNLLNLIFELNEPFNINGIYSKEFLEAQVDQPTKLPDFMTKYITWIKNQEDKTLTVQYENKLHSLFYEFALTEKNEFLRNYRTFELNTKNVLAAINCNQFNYTLNMHLIQTNPKPNIYNLLINNRLNYESFQEELPFAEQIFQIAKSSANLIEKEKSIDRIKWEYLDEHTFFHYFTIEKIISYVIKLQIIERWMKLDEKTGKELLNKLINELEMSYKFPEEFAL